MNLILIILMSEESPQQRPTVEASPSKSSRQEPFKRQKVVVRVPGTSANMGPGFDSMGMAVDIWNEIMVI